MLQFAVVPISYPDAVRIFVRGFLCADFCVRIFCADFSCGFLRADFRADFGFFACGFQCGFLRDFF